MKWCTVFYHTGILVHEPHFMTRTPNEAKYMVMTECELEVKNIEATEHLGKKIMGTVGDSSHHGSKHY
jgi:hypothetical protein